MSIKIVNKLDELNLKDKYINYLYEPRFSKKLDSNWKRHLFFTEIKNDFIKDVSSFGFSPYIQETYSNQIRDKNIMKFKKKNYEIGFLNYIHRKYIKSTDLKNNYNTFNYLKENINHPYSCKSLEIRRLLFKEEKEKSKKKKSKNNKNNSFYKMMKIIKNKKLKNENNNLTDRNNNNNKNDNFLSKALKRIEEQKKKTKNLKKNKKIFYTNNNTNNIDDIYDSDNEIIENDKLKNKYKIVKDSHYIINTEKNLPKYKKVFRKKVIKNQILKMAEIFQKDLFKTYKKNYSTSNSLRNSRKSIKYKNDVNFIISNNEKKFNNFEFENNENIQKVIKKKLFKSSNKKNDEEKLLKKNIVSLSNLNLKNINMNKLLKTFSNEFDDDDNENISTNDKTTRKKRYFYNLENASNGIFRQSIIQTQTNKRLKKIFAEEDKISDKYIIKIPKRVVTFSKHYEKNLSKN